MAVYGVWRTEFGFSGACRPKMDGLGSNDIFTRVDSFRLAHNETHKGAHENMQNGSRRANGLLAGIVCLGGTMDV